MGKRISFLQMSSKYLGKFTTTTLVSDTRGNKNKIEKMDELYWGTKQRELRDVNGHLIHILCLRDLGKKYFMNIVMFLPVHLLAFKFTQSVQAIVLPDF